MTDINFDIFINVIKRPELITYKSRVTDQSANIAYVGSTALSSDANMNIEDLAGSIAANRVVEDIVVSNVTESFSIETTDFLLTDIFTEHTNSAPKQPLFYQHKFSNFNPDTEYISKIKIYDDLLNEITFVYSKIDETKGVFYSNISSYYDIIPDQKDDPEGVEYTYYYITYNVTNKSTLAMTAYRELLNNLPIYREAEISDYNPDTLLLDIDSKAYTISPEGGGFTVFLPSPRNIAVDSKRDAKLKLLWPTSKGYSDPWHIRVPNGRFYYDGNLYKIVEEQFNLQSFNPEIGIKRIQKETPTLVTKNIIKLDHEDIVNDAESGLYVLVRVTRSSGSVTGFTTNSADISNDYSHWPTDGDQGIVSIDQKTGYIELINFELSFTDTIEVDYHYNEKYYDYTLVDFNPIRNESILRKTLVFFIDPTDPDKSLKHGEFDVLDNAVGPSEFLAETINGVSIFPQGEDVNLTTFEASTTSADGLLFVLGKVTVGESSGVRDLIILDTRIDGGSIKESKIEEVEAQYPTYTSFFNSGSWDGIPFPGNLSYLVQFPINGVVEDYGGKVAVKQLKEIIGRHTALGVYPIVRGYGPEIKFDTEDAFEISKVDANNISVKINWKAVDNTTYGIFYRKTSDEDWAIGPVFTPGSQTNTVVPMTVTVASLPSGSNYYFTVIGKETIEGTPTELFTQHISSVDTAIKTKKDFPDSLNILEVRALNL